MLAVLSQDLGIGTLARALEPCSLRREIGNGVEELAYSEQCGRCRRVYRLSSTVEIRWLGATFDEVVGSTIPVAGWTKDGLQYDQPDASQEAADADASQIGDERSVPRGAPDTERLAEAFVHDPWSQPSPEELTRSDAMAAALPPSLVRVDSRAVHDP